MRATISKLEIGVCRVFTLAPCTILREVHLVSVAPKTANPGTLGNLGLPPTKLRVERTERATRSRMTLCATAASSGTKNCKRWGQASGSLGCCCLAASCAAPCATKLLPMRWSASFGLRSFACSRYPVAVTDLSVPALSRSTAGQCLKEVIRLTLAPSSSVFKDDARILLLISSLRGVVSAKA